MATTTRKVQAKKVPAVEVTIEVGATKKATAGELLRGVLTLLDRTVAEHLVFDDIKFGKATPLVGGGAVYINRSNADVRLTTGAVAELAKSIPGATVRGPQGQYLRIPLGK